MKTLQPAAPRCRRCGKRLSDDIGVEDGAGVLEVGFVCVSCEWRQAQRPWTHGHIRARIAAVNARHEAVDGS